MEEREPEDDDEMGTLAGGYKSFQVHVVMNEESLRSRRRLTRGTGSLKQVEVMTAISSMARTLPERAGKHFSGTNQGETFENVPLPRPPPSGRRTGGLGYEAPL